MHSSWPFFGATSGLRQQQQPTDADSGDRSQNANGSFELNSFVRSLNRHGAQLPIGFRFRGANCIDSNKNEWTDRTAGKSLNELLTLLNDSVDRVVTGCKPEVRSNASSFASFRSGAEEKDPAALSDLIDLVSSTANEFRDIDAGNASSKNIPLSVGPRTASTKKSPLDIGLPTLVHPDVGTVDESSVSGFPAAASTLPVWQERTSTTVDSTRRNQRDVEDKPTGDDVFLTYPPELVEIYSENRTSGVKRAQLSAESLETLRQLETPRYLPGEVLRLARAAGFSGSPSVKRDRTTTTKRINFDDELWPVGPSVPSGRDFPPYFTGAPSRAFRCRGADRNFANGNERSMNASRSSPIFGAAGEAPAEPMEIVVPTRDGSDRSRELGMKEIIAGSSGDRLTPASIETIGIPDTDALYETSPTKLNKIEPIADGKKFKVEEAKSCSPEIETLVAEEEEEDVLGAEASDVCKREDQFRGPGACAKPQTKRRRVCRQTKKPGRKTMASSPKTDDEDNSAQETGSISQSPSASGRRSPPLRFLEVSREMGEDRSEDNERTGSVIGEDDTVETQIGMSLEIGRRRNFIGRSAAVRFRAVAKHSEMVISEKKKTDHRKIVAEDELPAMEERSRRVASANQKNRSQTNSAHPIWRPAGSVKVVPSSSSCSMARQSRIARLSTTGSDSRGEKPKERPCSINALGGSKVPVVGKNRSHGVFAKGSRGPAKNSEATTITPRSRSKQRPGTPRRASKTRIPEDARSEDKSLVRERSLRPLSSSESMRKTSSASDKLNGPEPIFKTAIPVLRSKTFVHQVRLEAPLRRVVSREDHKNNPKLTSTKRSRNSVTSGPVFTDAEESHSDVIFSPNSKFDKAEAPVESSSNDSIVLTSKAPQTSQKTAVLSSPEDKSNDKNPREEDTSEKMQRRKCPNRHAQSLRMLKDLLSHHGINVGVKGARGTSKDSPGSSKTLFEKLAILTEATPDDRHGEIKDSLEQSVFSLTDIGSESVASCARSVRDAGEQCSIRNESSIVLQTSADSEKSDSPRIDEPWEETAKEVSNVFTEIDEDYRRSIYTDAAVSPTPSVSEPIDRSCEVAETQTPRSAVDKDSATEEITQPISKLTSDVFTETERRSSASKEANTDHTVPEINDAASQVDPSEYSTETASGKDFADTECPSKCVNTDRPDAFLKSRGVCFRGPRKIDGNSQADNSEYSTETASGRDYVDSNVSECVNTDRQDYLFEDRSVEVLMPQTTEEACQADRPSSAVDTAVGDDSLDFKETTKSATRKDDEPIARKIGDRGHRLETVIVKDVDVVQWQSSTTFETSRINSSMCSSNSSIVAWRPVARCSEISSAEKLRSLSERVPKEAITALEIASERARNLYRAIGIYRENLMSRKANESIVKYCESGAENNSQIDRQIIHKTVAPYVKPCDFRENSMIKSLLEANLKKSFEPSRESSDLPVRLVEEDAERSKIQEEIASLVNDLVRDVIRDVETGDNDILLEESVLRPEILWIPHHSVEDSEEKDKHEEVDLPSSRANTSDFRLLSRNSLLTLIYGTVCSLVFWALQFSITCDSS